ncbi:dimethylarginine dimethylaminohydrolase family protein [Flammeovirga aprica]|uniref:arginine deiminase n=1 Tax=Flammeovirga aprica JL-4 TaxID=694437 RepID=A0A7X9RWH9_9BACT|nr:arginine deiminase family protein [Flammeovirga aprica]NME70023.1 hypothetical protein [Flammeovirga aprica JL-4]
MTEVVVGRWGSTLYLPNVDFSLKEFFPYITDEADAMGFEIPGQWYHVEKPEKHQNFIEEQEKLASTLESLGVKVRRPNHYEGNQLDALTTCYSRDPIITIGDKMIVANLRNGSRRAEKGLYLEILLDLAKNYKGEVIMMPDNAPGDVEGNVYLEGGDVFVNGNEIYVGHTGNASNEAGIKWLQETLGDDYKVYKVDLHRDVLHLDCAMMLLNDHQGIICKGDLVNQELPGKLKDYEWVEVTKEEANHMATNGVVVNPKTAIMADKYPHIIKEVEDKFGIKVIAIPFDKANYMGGDLRCSYQPIHRK